MRQFLMFTFLMVSIRTAYAEDNSPAYFGAVSDSGYNYVGIIVYLVT